MNDLFLVHVRNVKMTKKEGGTQVIERLPDERQIATVVCRSEGHFKQMLRVLIPAIRARDLGDERFLHSFQCEYAFTMNGGTDAIERCIKTLEDDRDESSHS